MKRPAFYIERFDWTRTSGGPRILHNLAHELHSRGEQVFFDAKHLRPPVVAIYPEITLGTPAGGDLVVRWLLNIPGAAGRDVSWSWNAADLLYHLYPQFARGNSRPLFVQFIDRSVFHSRDASVDRQGTAFYAKKAKLACPPGATDLSPHLRVRSWEELADLFRRIKTLYVGEQTALAIEAALCGCEVIYIPNAHLPSGGMTLAEYNELSAQSPQHIDHFIERCYKLLS